MGWKEFEKECYDYLRYRYEDDDVHFVKLGEEDSTKPDILVSIPNDSEFYMETKEPSAQCGQFVVMPNDRIMEFEYSKKNQSEENIFSTRMIAYMNNNYKEFRNAGTKGKKLELDEMLFVDWIKNYYKEKGVEFFITKGIQGYVIFPIDKFEDYFDVTAVYRMKKSGSTNPTQKNAVDVGNLLQQMNVAYSIAFSEKKMQVVSSAELDQLKAKQGKYEYYFRKTSNNNYRVTRLSNTKNSNVIFQIHLKKEQDLEDLKRFEKAIGK